ncbi:MAG TPA: DUF4838 domain-containing protein, partial [Abditibacteriaceae bacterium]|nr:DUF4838 domain-containing protein [Abditibacteriaceae bacterium]
LKRLIPTTLVTTSLLALSLAAREAKSAVPLVRDGKPLAKIYTIGPLAEPVQTEAEKAEAANAEAAPGAAKPKPVPPDAAALLRQTAVRELNYHLQKMSGTALEVVATEDPAAIQGPAIVLGEVAVKLGAQPQKTSQSKEGFRLLVKDDQLLIGGESDQAVLFGVYEVLEKLGCDWVMPGEIGEIIPRRTTVEFLQTDESQAPDFLIRRLWYRGYDAPKLPAEQERMNQWLLRQKSGNYSHPVGGTGGHVWDQFIARHKAEFDKDPTMYALRKAPDGTMKRMGPQLESTHPRVIELFAQEIRDAFAKNNWPKDQVAGFGIGPADGLGYSMSPQAVAAGSGRYDPIVGELDRTDEMILLANEIQKRIEKEYPNVYLGFYSYSTHADFPVRYVPHPRVTQIFAPINFSRYHGVLDPNSKTQAYYKDVVQQWGKLAQKQGNLLTYRGYSWNLAENMLPYTKAKIWGEELPFYKKMGIVGLNVEATKMWAVQGHSDYIFMKLAWDTSLDWKQLLREYCRKAFGEGAAPMESYFRRLIDTQHNSGQEAGSYHAFHLIFNDAFVAAAEKDLSEAWRLAKQPEEKTRVEYTGAAVEALKLYLDYHKATLEFDFPRVKKAYDAMQASWQKWYEVNTDLVANEAPAYLKRFLVQFVDQGLQYSTGDYKMIHRLPDVMPTMLDPEEVGHTMRYQAPDLDDSKFFKTKTYSTTWDAQGLTGLRKGAVWYRHRFTLPAEAKGKPIGLFIGGVEDEARVWLNGKVIGTSGRRFSFPSAFDLTDDIKAEGENVLVLQIVRNSAANEIGVGGLMRPSFLFTGPRLELKAPQPLNLPEALPGGGDIK